MASSSGFVVGFATGALAAILVLKLREQSEQESEQHLYSEMDRRIAELEVRTEKLKPKPLAKAKA